MILLFIAMPVKYLLGHPELVRVIGGVHGVLFLAYMGFALKAAFEHSWAKEKLVICAVLSCLPGGTFYFERKYLMQPET